MSVNELYNPTDWRDNNPNLRINDTVSVTNPFHSRYGEPGIITATTVDRFTNPKFPYLSRVRFSDKAAFWINNGYLELLHHSAPGIPGED